MMAKSGDQGDPDGTISAAEAFSILGNEVRVGILRALWWADCRLSYADLRREVSHGGRGNFNYHLNKLVGYFVRKTSEGYALSYAGEEVIRAVGGGTITVNRSLPPAEIDERCVYCEGRVEVRCEHEHVTVRCTDCGGVRAGEFGPGTLVRGDFPPPGLEGRTPEATADAVQTLREGRRAMMRRDVCPECGGSTTLSFDVCPDHERGPGGLCSTCVARYEVWSVHQCERCSFTLRSVAWFAALHHPTVVAFLAEHGLDSRGPIRTVTGADEAFVRDISGRVLERDPFRFLVSIPFDGEVLEVRLDEDLDVLDTERTTTSDP